MFFCVFLVVADAVMCRYGAAKQIREQTCVVCSYSGLPQNHKSNGPEQFGFKQSFSLVGAHISGGRSFWLCQL